MGRRALRKVDPNLDLSRHWLDAAKLPAKFDACELFGRVAPLEVEVGSGKGLFLVGACRSYPDHDFIGIELAKKYAHYAAARLARAALPNGKMISGDGLRVFREWIPGESLAGVHVYFPDPWWKSRHKKRRVLNDAFLRDVVRTLAVGGRLHFWTDVEEYFQTTLELIAATVKLRGPMPVEEKPAEHDLDYRTHFERRTRKNQEPVYRAEFIKSE